LPSGRRYNDIFSAGDLEDGPALFDLPLARVCGPPLNQGRYTYS